MKRQLLFFLVAALCLAVTVVGMAVAGQDVLDRTREGLAEAQRVLDPGEVPETVAVVEPEPEETATIEEEREWDYIPHLTLAVLALVAVLLIAVLFRLNPRVTNEQTNAIGQLTELQVYRLKALMWFVTIAGLVMIGIETAEVVASVYLPGFEETINEIHVPARAAFALFFAGVLIFGPWNRHVLPTVTWMILLWGPLEAEVPDGRKPMPEIVRAALIVGLFWLMVTIMNGIFNFNG